MNRFPFWFRTVCMTVLMTFALTTVSPPSGFAATLDLPPPGSLLPVSEAYRPITVMGLRLHPQDPLQFDFIVDPGDAPYHPVHFREESQRLIAHFLTSLTLPKKDIWVNLSPYEEGRVINDKFGLTEMGRQMLEQDYMLKQLTASMIYPDEDLGKAFWEKVFAKAYEEYGTTDIPVNTFNKVWVIPDRAVVYENAELNAALVVETHLKIMLDQDYLAQQKNADSEKFGTTDVEQQEMDEISAFTAGIIRDLVIPEIEREVNEGKSFAPLRQIYHSLILAQWYKEALRDSILNQAYADRGKVRGVDTNDAELNDRIYELYMQAFQQGVFDFIRDDFDPNSMAMIPRKYFSGGMTGDIAVERTKDEGRIRGTLSQLANRAVLLEAGGRTGGGIGRALAGIQRGLAAAGLGQRRYTEDELQSLITKRAGEQQVQQGFFLGGQAYDVATAVNGEPLQVDGRVVDGVVFVQVKEMTDNYAAWTMVQQDGKWILAIAQGAKLLGPDASPDLQAVAVRHELTEAAIDGLLFQRGVGDWKSRRDQAHLLTSAIINTQAVASDGKTVHIQQDLEILAAGIAAGDAAARERALGLYNEDRNAKLTALLSPQSREVLTRMGHDPDAVIVGNFFVEAAVHKEVGQILRDNNVELAAPPESARETAELVEREMADAGLIAAALGGAGGAGGGRGIVPPVNIDSLLDRIRAMLVGVLDERIAALERSAPDLALQIEVDRNQLEDLDRQIAAAQGEDRTALIRERLELEEGIERAQTKLRTEQDESTALTERRDEFDRRDYASQTREGIAEIMAEVGEEMDRRREERAAESGQQSRVADLQQEIEGLNTRISAVESEIVDNTAERQRLERAGDATTVADLESDLEILQSRRARLLAQRDVRQARLDELQPAPADSQPQQAMPLWKRAVMFVVLLAVLFGVAGDTFKNSIADTIPEDPNPGIAAAVAGGPPGVTFNDVLEGVASPGAGPNAAAFTADISEAGVEPPALGTERSLVAAAAAEATVGPSAEELMEQEQVNEIEVTFLAEQQPIAAEGAPTMDRSLTPDNVVGGGPVVTEEDFFNNDPAAVAALKQTLDLSVEKATSPPIPKDGSFAGMVMAYDIDPYQPQQFDYFVSTMETIIGMDANSGMAELPENLKNDVYPVPVGFQFQTPQDWGWSHVSYEVQESDIGANVQETRTSLAQAMYGVDAGERDYEIRIGFASGNQNPEIGDVLTVTLNAADERENLLKRVEDGLLLASAFETGYEPSVVAAVAGAEAQSPAFAAAASPAPAGEAEAEVAQAAPEPAAEEESAAPPEAAPAAASVDPTAQAGSPAEIVTAAASASPAPAVSPEANDARAEQLVEPLDISSRPVSAALINLAEVTTVGALSGARDALLAALDDDSILTDVQKSQVRNIVDFSVNPALESGQLPDLELLTTSILANLFARGIVDEAKARGVPEEVAEALYQPMRAARQAQVLARRSDRQSGETEQVILAQAMAQVGLAAVTNFAMDRLEEFDGIDSAMKDRLNAYLAVIGKRMGEVRAESLTLLRDLANYQQAETLRQAWPEEELRGFAASVADRDQSFEPQRQGLRDQSENIFSSIGVSDLSDEQIKTAREIVQAVARDPFDRALERRIGEEVSDQDISNMIQAYRISYQTYATQRSAALRVDRTALSWLADLPAALQPFVEQAMDDIEANPSAADRVIQRGPTLAPQPRARREVPLEELASGPALEQLQVATAAVAMLRENSDDVAAAEGLVGVRDFFAAGNDPLAGAIFVGMVAPFLAGGGGAGGGRTGGGGAGGGIAALRRGFRGGGPRPEETTPPDRAGADAEAPLGGIDFEKLGIEVRLDGDNRVITIFHDPAQLQQLIDSEGLAPVIYGIQPLPAPMLNMILGLGPEGEGAPEAARFPGADRQAAVKPDEQYFIKPEATPDSEPV